MGVDLYYKDKAASLKKHGPFSQWGTSKVTSMRSLFAMQKDFNGDISGWDVSNVDDMYAMFRGAVSFNGDLSGWNVSNVKHMG